MLNQVHSRLGHCSPARYLDLEMWIARSVGVDALT